MDDKRKYSRNALKVVAYEQNKNGKDKSIPTEIYKKISEDNFIEQPITNGFGETATSSEESLQSEERKLSSQTKPQNGNSNTMQQEDSNIDDGADEQMLDAPENENLEPKREEVKFIKGDQKNGDAKIDIGIVNGKAFCGMNKDELMKYANDPFWVRLRLIFFIGFWAIWLAMLVAAIWLIVSAPKCAAPTPLDWYKGGLFAKVNGFNPQSTDLEMAKKMQANGIIYELPSELTYSVKEPSIESQIKAIVDQYKDTNKAVIFDVTPNYVINSSLFMKEAISNRNKRSPFVWVEQPKQPNNWVALEGDSAWSEVEPQNFVLSQFGNGRYDLRMNDELVVKEFSEVLKHLIKLGVKGIRLKNTKYYIISSNMKDESPSARPGYVLNQYGFWTHHETTFQEGLGDLLGKFKIAIKEANSDAFLSVSEDVVRPEVYKKSDQAYGLDMLIYGRFTNFLSNPKGKQLKDELTKTINTIGDDGWLQWSFDEPPIGVNASAVQLFMSLLPGVCVIPINSTWANVSERNFEETHLLRETHSFMHGELKVHDGENLLAYTRIKAGNPGYLVIFNPTDTIQKGNFTDLELPETVTVDLVSDNYKDPDIGVGSRIANDKIEVSPFGSIIYTYVPLKE